MNASHAVAPPAPARRWYAPDYRRRLREAGAFRGLTASAQVVLAALCDRANAAGVAWPTVETIARDYGIGESTVRRALGELVAAGLVLAARRNGRVTKYALVVPKRIMASVDPEQDPSRIGPPPLSNRAPIMIRDQFKDHKEQHDSAESGAAVVVVEEEDHQESAAASPPAEDSFKNSDTIDLLMPDLVDRARAVGLAPAKVNRYGADRVRWVLDALDAERARRVIGNPAGWVMQALREQWELPGPVVQRALPLDQAVAAARPPEGTRWARARGGAITLEVLDANDDRVQFAGGSVVPAHRWPDWEWFAEHPGAPADVGADVEGKNLVPTDARRSAEKGAALARLRLWMSLRPRPAVEVDAKLKALRLTADEWEAYQAAEAWLENNG